MGARDVSAGQFQERGLANSTLAQGAQDVINREEMQGLGELGRGAQNRISALIAQLARDRQKMEFERETSMMGGSGRGGGGRGGGGGGILTDYESQKSGQRVREPMLASGINPNAPRRRPYGGPIGGGTNVQGRNRGWQSGNAGGFE